jgi:hypothetical protein
MVAFQVYLTQGMGTFSGISHIRYGGLSNLSHIRYGGLSGISHIGYSGLVRDISHKVW